MRARDGHEGGVRGQCMRGASSMRTGRALTLSFALSLSLAHTRESARERGGTKRGASACAQTIYTTVSTLARGPQWEIGKIVYVITAGVGRRCRCFCARRDTHLTTALTARGGPPRPPALGAPSCAAALHEAARHRPKARRAARRASERARAPARELAPSGPNYAPIAADVTANARAAALARAVAPPAPRTPSRAPPRARPKTQWRRLGVLTHRRESGRRPIKTNGSVSEVTVAGATWMCDHQYARLRIEALFERDRPGGALEFGLGFVVW